MSTSGLILLCILFIFVAVTAHAAGHQLKIMPGQRVFAGYFITRSNLRIATFCFWVAAGFFAATLIYRLVS